VDQAELELQLKVWKDLAISKQILIQAATDALGLDPDCKSEELKLALATTIKQGIEADINVSKAREQSDLAITVMEKKIAASEKTLAMAENAKSDMQAIKEKSEQDMADERIAHAKEMKKIKDLLAAKESALKAINKALADTPENVIKKLKTLKKQKDDESTARKLVEVNVTSLRKEKRQLEQQLSETQENSKTLATQHRELHKQFGEGTDEKPLPELDEELLEAIEKTDKEK